MISTEEVKKFAGANAEGSSGKLDAYPGAVIDATVSNLNVTDTFTSVEVIARARNQLIESLEFVPDEDKAAYLEAVKRVPHLVELESNPDHQLQYTGYDPWKAALRLATYWKTRVDLFGERAFLPMTLTGYGAMSQEDIDVLNTGFLIVLPEDNKGRAVLFHDRARLTNRKYMVGLKRIRCLFYVLSVIAESEKSRRLGIIGLATYTDKTRGHSFDFQYTNKAVVSLLEKEVIPVPLHGTHIVMLTQRPVLRKVIPLTVQLLQKVTNIQLFVHIPECPDQILQELIQEHGFEIGGIPKVPFGGFYTIGCFRLWLEDRHRREAVIYSTRNTTVKLPPDASHEEEKARKRREAEAAIARLKRAKKLNEVKVMQEEVERLRAQNQTLQDTNNKLETQLRYAHFIVESYNGPTQGHLPTTFSVMNRNELATDQCSGASFVPQAAPQSFNLTSGANDPERQQHEAILQLQQANTESCYQPLVCSLMNINVPGAAQHSDESLIPQSVPQHLLSDGFQQLADSDAFHGLSHWHLPAVCSVSNENVSEFHHSDALFTPQAVQPSWQYMGLQHETASKTNEKTPASLKLQPHEARFEQQLVDSSSPLYGLHQHPPRPFSSINPSLLHCSDPFPLAQQQSPSDPLLYTTEVTEPTTFVGGDLPFDLALASLQQQDISHLAANQEQDYLVAGAVNHHQSTEQLQKQEDESLFQKLYSFFCN